MKVSRVVRGSVALALVLGLVPMGAAQAAVNKPPRIKKAELKDKDGDGLADRIVLTYNERINHKLDTSRFPFRVDGYKIVKVNGARRSLRLTIILRENPNAPAKPAFVKYSRTRKQPVKDLKRKQAAKQLLTKNILGLTVTPPPGEVFTLQVAKGGDGLGVVADDSSQINCGPTCSATYPAGTNVTLTATPDSTTKATFASWTGCTSATNTCTVTMDADKTVTAMFSKAGTFLLSVTKAGAGTGTVTSTSNPSPAGQAQINCGATCTASYAKDTIVTLSASPEQGTGSTFAGFSGGGCTGNLTTCNVTMDAAKTVTATFDKIGTFMLTVTKAGTGLGTVTSGENPAKINCGSDCTEGYPAATQVTLTATPDTAGGATFTGWSGDSCTGSTNTCTLTMNAAKTVTATFAAATQRTLTVTPTGTGTVTATSPSQADGINCGSDCTAKYANGTTVTLSAAPGQGFEFTSWGNGATCGATPTCQVVMDADKTVTATFTSLTPVKNLNVTVTGGTATCVSSKLGPLETCNGGFDADDSVAITVTPSPTSLPVPTWGGACTGTVGLICTVDMTEHRIVTAVFAPGVEIPDVGGGVSLP